MIEAQRRTLEQLDQQIVELEETVKEKQMIIEQHEADFSYLSDLSEAELEAYKLFREEKDTEHLSQFSPEKIVLIYYHSVVIGDIDAIYTLTYNDGTLPDLVTFQQTYTKEGLLMKDLNSAATFRYYHSIEVREEDQTDKDAFVEMRISYGKFNKSIIYGLEKESGIWKMDRRSNFKD
ncbi:MAG: hypothetical protein ACQER2_02515 [Bacillota bacterium]